MSLHVNSLILFFQVSLADETRYYHSTKTKKVYIRPSSRVLKGMIAPYDSFVISERLEGTSSCPVGWGRVHDNGVICMKSVQETDTPPTAQPMMEFIPPNPEEFEYDHANPPSLSLDVPVEPFVPHIHARIMDGSRGRLWASADAYESGEAPNWRLKENRDYRFVDVIDTKKGMVLERPNGRVTPVEEWFVYPVSQFMGRDIVEEPPALGHSIAWAVEKSNAPIYASPSQEQEPVGYASFQESFDVVVVDEEWLQIDSFFGEDQDGYIQSQYTRRWIPAEKPEYVQDDIWIDIHLSQQTLAVYQGDDLLYVTLISSAKDGFTTPTGIYNIYSKSSSWDLGSKKNAAEYYYMENVPWVMHYYPRYAIHSAFWHADFGMPASHGCINMSVRDIAHVFSYMEPMLPKGWWVIREDREERGSIVRIRKNSLKLQDKRRKR